MSSMRYRRVVYFQYAMAHRVHWLACPGDSTSVWRVVNRRWIERAGATSVTEYALVPIDEPTLPLTWVSEADIRLVDAPSAQRGTEGAQA